MTSSQIRRLRRKRTRGNYLAELAARDPERFVAEWRSLSQSWVSEIQYRAARLNDEDGRAVPAAYAVLEEAMRLLHACGETAESLVKQDTRACLGSACARSLTQAQNAHLHRLSTADHGGGR